MLHLIQFCAAQARFYVKLNTVLRYVDPFYVTFITFLRYIAQFYVTLSSVLCYT